MTNVVPFDPARIVSERQASIARPLEKGGGGGNDDGMESRVAKLEESVTDVRERLARIETKVDSIDKHGATSAQLNAMESKMIRWFVGTALALSGAAFAIARLVQ